MHPPPSSSIRLHPTHFNLQPALCNTLNIWTKILHIIGQFPKICQKTKCCPVWLKIGTHNIVEVLIPNPELDFWNSDPNSFWANLGPKIQSCWFCLKIGTHGITKMLISKPDLDFWNFDTKIHFWANLGPKSQSCLFCLKIGTHGISRMLILIATLVFWISNLNFLFGQICMSTVCQY